MVPDPVGDVDVDDRAGLVHDGGLPVRLLAVDAGDADELGDPAGDDPGEPPASDRGAAVGVDNGR
jgi:hypothetical protein